MSTSLAVRQRPHTWAEVAGQQHLVEVLRAAAARRPVPQQILLAGPSGVGKTTMARIFAAALFCPNATDGAGCGECETCRDVTGPGGRHPDVIELDAASHGGIEQIRSLGSEASLAPLLAPWRVYIIDEAHGLTKDGAQAFLRLLEEPPAHTIFILATTDPQKLPDALRGRCLLCYATAPDRAEKIANLRRVADDEGWDLADDVLGAVVDATDPALGVRGTVTNLDKVAGALAPGASVSAAQAAVLLGVADPALFTALTAAIVAGDRAGALAALTQTLDHSARSVVHIQLLEWARTQLRTQAPSGAVEGPAWMLQQLAAHPAEHLEVAVAKMASPHLGGPDGLAALVERAEAAAAALANAPTGLTRPAPAPAPAPGPAPQPPAPVFPGGQFIPPAQQQHTAAPNAAPNAAPQQPAQPFLPPLPTHHPSPHPAPAAAPGPAVTWATVPASDAGLLAWCNAMARHDPMWALQLRRSRIERSDAGWRISVSFDEDGFRDALVATAGAPVTFA